MNSQSDENKYLNLSLLVNPIYLVYERDRDAEERQEFIHGTPVYDIRLPIIECESSKTSTKEHFAKKKFMALYFKGNFGFLYGDDIQILTITFIVSMIIAVDLKYRQQFYSHYVGKVPAITQFILDNVRVGRVPEGYNIRQINFDPMYKHFSKEAGLPELFRLDFKDNNFFRILAWFHLLDLHFSKDDLFFKHFVNLKKTPFLSNKPLTLTSLSQTYDKKKFINSTATKSKQEEKYIILNKSLNAKIVDPNSLMSSELLFFDENNSTDFIQDEDQLASQLINLIINCEPDS